MKKMSNYNYTSKDAQTFMYNQCIFRHILWTLCYLFSNCQNLRYSNLGCWTPVFLVFSHIKTKRPSFVMILWFCISFFNKNATSFTYTKDWNQLQILFHRFTNRQNETHLMNAFWTPLVHKILQIKLTLALLGKKCFGRNWREKTL